MQTIVDAGVAATSMPVGRVSVKVVSGIVDPAFGLVSTIDSVIGSPTRPGDGLNVLLPVGCSRDFTDSVAIAGVVLVTTVAASVAWKPATAPPGVKPLAGPFAGIVFCQLPAVVDTTSMSNVHAPSTAPLPAGICPPESTICDVPGVAVTVANAQVSTMFGGFGDDHLREQVVGDRGGRERHQRTVEERDAQLAHVARVDGRRRELLVDGRGREGERCGKGQHEADEGRGQEAGGTHQRISIALSDACGSTAAYAKR